MRDRFFGRPAVPAILAVLAALGTVVAYGFALHLDVMEIDAAQYAAMARQMADSGPWLGLFDRGVPYLDKPPLLFWLTAASFKVFGVSNLTYRLPSFLAFGLGAYSTYALARHYAGARAGRLAALVLVTCQGGFLMNLDVRTDTLLTGLVAFSLWQGARFLDRPRSATAALLGIGIGGAMLTKGLIGLMVPLAGIGAQIGAQRNWGRTRDPRWLVTGGIAGALLVPMVLGLYRQHGVEGLRFYFWTQGFGRIFSENIWGDAHGPFFFVPQLMWTFLPWTLFLALALWTRLSALRRAGWRATARHEAFTIGAFALGFIGLSLSRSKLPHYLYVTLPPAAVLTGTWLDEKLPTAGKILTGLQRVVLVSIAIVAGTSVAWVFPLGPGWLWGGIGVLWLAAFRMAGARIALPRLPSDGPRQGQASERWGEFGPGRLVLASTLTIAGANLALNGQTYPRLLEFQSSAAAGRRILAEERTGPRPRDAPERLRLIAFQTRGRALDFYARRPALPATRLEDLRRVLTSSGTRDPAWIYTTREGLEEMRAGGLEPEVMARFDDFPVSKVTLRFLDPGTRSIALSERVLARVVP